MGTIFPEMIRLDKMEKYFHSDFFDFRKEIKEEKNHGRKNDI